MRRGASPPTAERKAKTPGPVFEVTARHVESVPEGVPFVPVLKALALRLALTIDNAQPGENVAALSREWRATLDAIDVKAGRATQRPKDELAERRRRRAWSERPRLDW